MAFEALLERYMDAQIVISTRLYHKEIYAQLVEHGIDEENIIDAGRMIDEMSDRQYFDLPYLTHSADEVFVDAGCFDGKTSLLFTEWCEGEYKHIWAFEPDEDNADLCEKKFLERRIENADVIRSGLWDKETDLSFHAVNTGASRVAESGTVWVPVKRLDDVLPEKATFLKLDIEGAEYKALEGAKNLIMKQKPKLAVSIYHKQEDIWELPELLLSYNPDYTFYLRHYSVAADETVLYAL